MFEEMTKLVQLLQSPPDEAKGWTRWWWFGCAVSRKEIRRELEIMAQSGLGGVEIAILYPLAADDPEQNIYNIPFFSPEFFEILDYTEKEARKLGLGVDFTLGSSWPYGGTFITKDQAAQVASTWQLDVTGPKEDFEFDFTTVIPGKITRVIMGQMVHSVMQPETIRDITGNLEDKTLYGYPWGTQLKHLAIPEGDWKIMAVIINDYSEHVLIPTREAHGLVMDHCRRDVMDHFLKNAAQPLADYLGPDRLRCVFCDSIELNGNNWTAILLEEFQKRRGYDLSPYLYGLWGDLGKISGNIRHDYYLTMSELTLENFFDRLTQWSHENGMRSRIQAHGTWADILKAYAMADIPEGETFSNRDCLEVNTIHRRLASSAGHVYGRPIISNESFTWLRMPRFLVTMEQVKAAVDAIFLDGMNCIVNHGYAYSPEEVGTPGWPFYASSNLNHTNPAWDCYPQVAKYIQRVSAMLRQGYCRSDVAIYLPQADIWSDTTIANLHMAMRLQERFGWDVPDRICRAGYSFDYVNDEALQSLSVMEGGMRIGENTYKVLILLACDRLPVETAKALDAFVRSGGILVAAEAAPTRSCGLMDHETRDAQVAKLMTDLFPAEQNRWKASGKGFAAVAPDRREGLISLIREKRLPDVEVLPAGCPVGYQHRRTEAGNLYFIANISKETQRFTLELADPGEAFGIYNAETAQPMACLGTRADHGRRTLELELEAFGSAFILFGEGVETMTPVERLTESQTLVGWTLEAAGENFTCAQETPDYWQTIPKLKYFVGPGDYKTTFHLPALDGSRLFVEVAEVSDAARVLINGVECGKLWKRPWRVEITDAVREGVNELTIRATGSLINYAINPENEPQHYEDVILKGWPYFADSINPIRKRRIGFWREREMVKDVQNAGIHGQVRIVKERQ